MAGQDQLRQLDRCFQRGGRLSPHIITCSWGSDVRVGPLSAADQTLAVAIADAVARGIVVVFSAGNGHFGFPGQHPDVISAGGVFLTPAATCAPATTPAASPARSIRAAIHPICAAWSA